MHSAIDLRLLRSFIAVARAGSVTRAAARLHLTQPALSQHLRELADLLDVTLFDRVGRGILLTQAGADLFAEVEPILSKLDVTLANVRNRSREVHGALRIGAIDTYARSLVMPTISALLARHPQLYVSVQELPAAAIDQGLVENELDIGVSFSHLSHADIEQRTLFIERLALVHRSAGRKIRKTVSLREVATHPLALLNRTFAMRGQIDAACAGANIALNVRVEAANVDSLIRLVERADYATIASPLAIPHRSKIVAATIADDGLSRIAALRWRRGKTFTPAMERFEEALSHTIRSSGLDMPDNDSVRTSKRSPPAGTRRR
ncbi:DNA-binding transcriptional regulator CynR [Burkholderia contaminans]|uniref:LysR substrate-binding domain-containing protein n=1 Tax=Burkholderia contaminans TaxID=488447 RepID=UPI001452DA28|nr:LysR substrate-binding domain-containing protein [Burkholderia contaminans]VWC71836.1 DNA-binding transcriptional regulator CynR [Burkholderia contaminans]HEM7880317.1 LysR family transcriptional regulator [Burkholderia contaminans]